MRALGFLLLCSMALAAPEGESRLGTLIRWYLAESSPARRSELIERIRQLTGDDPAKVAAAIRAGKHFQHDARPAFGKGGKVPVFQLMRFRIQSVAGSAGDFANLVLPPDYTPDRAWPLVIDLGARTLPVPPATVQVRVRLMAHPQADRHALAAEGLVLSLLARTLELVHVDVTRVFLRSMGDVYTPLAWYIALHNPDRFAGFVAAQGSWREAVRLAPNSLLFSICAIQKRKGDSVLTRFMGKDPRFAVRHRVLRAPASPRDDKKLLPPLFEWSAATLRPANPASLTVVSDREASTRAYWVRVVAKHRSIRRGTISRVWSHKSMSTPGSLEARIDQNDRNLIRVTTRRVNTFEIWVDPAMFDVDRPLRVAINGGAPVASLIDHNLSIDTLLEDYARRRDPQLLYQARFAFTVRRER